MTMVSTEAQTAEKRTEVKHYSSASSGEEYTEAFKSEDEVRLAPTKSPTFLPPPTDPLQKHAPASQKSSSQYHSIQKLCTPISSSSSTTTTKAASPSFKPSNSHIGTLQASSVSEVCQKNIDNQPSQPSKQASRTTSDSLNFQLDGQSVGDDCTEHDRESTEFIVHDTTNHYGLKSLYNCLNDTQCNGETQKNATKSKFLLFEKSLENVRKDVEVLKTEFEGFLLEACKEEQADAGRRGLESREMCALLGLLRRELSRNIECHMELVLGEFMRRHLAEMEKPAKSDLVSESEQFSNNNLFPNGVPHHLYTPLINNFINRTHFPSKTYFPQLHNYSNNFRKSLNLSLYNHFNPAYFFNHCQLPTSSILNNSVKNHSLSWKQSFTPENPSSSEPEQTEALPLLVSSKRKRTKVVDSPKTHSSDCSHDDDHYFSLQRDEEDCVAETECAEADYSPRSPYEHQNTAYASSLATSVAILNPSMSNPHFLNALYKRKHFNTLNFNSVYDKSGLSQCKKAKLERKEEGRRVKFSEGRCFKEETACIPSSSLLLDGQYADHMMISFGGTLTPVHLRKAKLMFFYVRYPSSSTLKAFFPDVLFNKNNTAQLIKWFSNFREFYYIQMEKYARQALSEGIRCASHLHVEVDSELYRVLVLHYNRNHKIEVPENFQLTVQMTLREFFKAILADKDHEQSWKKAIYKVIARLDDVIPEYFKKVNWMEELIEN